MNRYVEVGDRVTLEWVSLVVCTVMLVLGTTMIWFVFKRGSLHCACFIYHVISFVLFLLNEHVVSI